MLPDNLYNILAHIESHKGHKVIMRELSTVFGSSAASEVSVLVGKGFAYTMPPYDYCQTVTVGISDNGLQALYEHRILLKRQREQDAKKDEQARAEALQREKDKKQAFRNNLIVAVISSLVTLAVEHCMELIDLFGKLIHWVASLFH